MDLQRGDTIRIDFICSSFRKRTNIAQVTSVQDSFVEIFFDHYTHWFEVSNNNTITESFRDSSGNLCKYDSLSINSIVE